MNHILKDQISEKVNVVVVPELSVVSHDLPQQMEFALNL